MGVSDCIVTIRIEKGGKGKRRRVKRMKGKWRILGLPHELVFVI